MKLEFVKSGDDFIGLDLLPEGVEDRRFCRDINRAFRAGDLHISTDKSRHIIVEYDGECRSFPIKERECLIIDESLEEVFHGEARFMVGSSLVYDHDDPYCICILRFHRFPKKELVEKGDFQQKITKSYIPPVSLLTGGAKKHTCLHLGRQYFFPKN